MADSEELVVLREIARYLRIIADELTRGRQQRLRRMHKALDTVLR